MAQVEWIKLSTNTFKDEKIKLLKALPDGHALLIVWFELLAQAGIQNDGGYIYIAEGVPYMPEQLSIIFDEKLTVINSALNWFRQFDMIGEDERGLYIVNWEKHQNVAGMDKIRQQNAARQAKRRKKLKELPPGNTNEDGEPPRGENGESRDGNVTGHGDVTPGHETELELERDKEKEKDIAADDNVHAHEEDLPFELDSRGEIFLPLDQPTTITLPEQLHDFAAQKVGTHFLSPADYQFLVGLLRDGVPVDVIQKGITQSFATFEPKNKYDKIRSIKYCEGKIGDLYAIYQQEQAYQQAATTGGDGNAKDQRPVPGSGHRGSAGTGAQGTGADYYADHPSLVEEL